MKNENIKSAMTNFMLSCENLIDYRKLNSLITKFSFQSLKYFYVHTGRIFKGMKIRMRMCLS